MEKCFSLSKKQISRLEDILPRPRRKIDLGALVKELDKIGSRYKKALKRLAVLPALETWDRCLADGEFNEARLDEERQLTARQLKASSDRVARADQELVRLCADTATVWEKLTGRPLPGWPTRLRRRLGMALKAEINSVEKLGFVMSLSETVQMP